MTDDFDILVVGSGVAGLSAGLTATRLGQSTMILTGDILGGNLLSIEKIDFHPDYPEGVPGYELCPMMEEDAADEGAEFSGSELLKLALEGDIWRASTNDGDFSARSVILATGNTLKELAIPGEENYRGKGVSHCASCDAPLLRDQDVVVIGGGDSALQEALTLAEAAAKVTILTQDDKLSAQEYYQEQVVACANIEFLFNCQAKEIIGDDTVSAVRYIDSSSGSENELAADGVFIYVGLQPNTGFLNGLLSLDPSGRIVTNEKMATDKSGIFAAGTVRAGSVGKAISAIKEGEAAANAAVQFLKGGAK